MSNKAVLTIFEENGRVQLQAGTGASSKIQCTCKPGFFFSRQEAVRHNVSLTFNWTSLRFDDPRTADLPCQACPSSSYCMGAHYEPLARPGFGALRLLSPDEDAVFHECPNSEFCSAPGFDGSVFFQVTIRAWARAYPVHHATLSPQATRLSVFVRLIPPSLAYRSLTRGAIVLVDCTRPPRI